MIWPDGRTLPWENHVGPRLQATCRWPVLADLGEGDSARPTAARLNTSFVERERRPISSFECPGDRTCMREWALMARSHFMAKKKKAAKKKVAKKVAKKKVAKKAAKKKAKA